VPLRDKHNNLTGILGISIDITNSRCDELEKLETLEKIIAMVPKESVYLGCNDNQALSAGLKSRQEIVGKHNKDLPWNMNDGVLPETIDEG
jgi:hypothetical protein